MSTAATTETLITKAPIISTSPKGSPRAKRYGLAGVVHVPFPWSYLNSVLVHSYIPLLIYNPVGAALIQAGILAFFKISKQAGFIRLEIVRQWLFSLLVVL